MSQRQDKRLRREVRRYFAQAGATPDQIRKRWALAMNPKPRWWPWWLWNWMCGKVLKAPAAFAE